MQTRNGDHYEYLFRPRSVCLLYVESGRVRSGLGLVWSGLVGHSQVGLAFECDRGGLGSVVTAALLACRTTRL